MDRYPAIVRRRPLLIAAGLAVLTAGCSHNPTVHGPAHSAPQDATIAPTAGPPTVPARPDDCEPSPVAAAPQYYLDEGPKAIALTIDDGPDPRYTPDVLKILADHGVTAAFCMVGQHAAANPELVRKVADGGHMLVNHTWSHPDDLAGLPADQLQQEIERAGQAIGNSGGVRPVFFRAPGGAFTPTVLTACAGLGLQPLAWSVDPHDWQKPGTERIVSTVLHATHTGSIILNHDGGGDRSQTVAALRTYLPRLLAAGYHFTTPAPTLRPAADDCR